MVTLDPNAIAKARPKEAKTFTPPMEQKYIVKLKK